MAAQLEDRLLDFGLNELDTLATDLVICSAEPTVYSLTTAGAANQLGRKNFGAGSLFGSPAAGSPGRKVTSVSITDGTITTTGTATWWAVVDVTNLRLLAHNTLSAAQAVTATNTFTLAAFDIKMLNS